MAAIKSCTDIEQSKKLAEILPLESADMYYFDDNEEPNFKVRNGITYYYDSEDFLCCWSLAALISIIPQELFNGEYIINITEGLNHKWIISYEHYSEVSSYIDVSSNSLIDCCVEIIIKLKERNLL